MPYKKIESASLTKLLDLPKSKQVLAFEEVMMDDLDAYSKWAFACMGEIDRCVDDALIPVVSIDREKSINYFEIRDCLKLFTAAIEIVPPTASEAVRLYVYGCLEDVVYRKDDRMSALEEIVDVIESREGMQKFSKISQFYTNFWYPMKNQSCGSVLEEFSQEAERLLKENTVEVIRQNNKWKIIC